MSWIDVYMLNEEDRPDKVERLVRQRDAAKNIESRHKKGSPMRSFASIVKARVNRRLGDKSALDSKTAPDRYDREASVREIGSGNGMEKKYGEWLPALHPTKKAALKKELARRFPPMGEERNMSWLSLYLENNDGVVTEASGSAASTILRRARRLAGDRHLFKKDAAGDADGEDRVDQHAHQANLGASSALHKALSDVYHEAGKTRQARRAEKAADMIDNHSLQTQMANYSKPDDDDAYHDAVLNPRYRAKRY